MESNRRAGWTREAHSAVLVSMSIVQVMSMPMMRIIITKILSSCNIHSDRMMKTGVIGMIRVIVILMRMITIIILINIIIP